MMFEEVMIQNWGQLNLCRKSKKYSGGVGVPPPPQDVRRSDDSNRGAMIQERVR